MRFFSSIGNTIGELRYGPWTRKSKMADCMKCLIHWRKALNYKQCNRGAVKLHIIIRIAISKVNLRYISAFKRKKARLRDLWLPLRPSDSENSCSTVFRSRRLQHDCDTIFFTMILEFLGLNFKNKNPRLFRFCKLQVISSNQNTTINLSLFIKVKASYYFGESLIKSTMWVRRFVTVPYIVYLFCFNFCKTNKIV